MPIALTGMTVSLVKFNPLVSISFFAFLLLLGGILILNKLGKTQIARLLLSVLPPLFFMMVFLIGELGRHELQHSISFIFVGLAVIPLILFHRSSERVFLTIGLLVHLSIIIGLYILMKWVGSDLLLYSVPQLIAWVLIVGAFEFLKRENILMEQHLDGTNARLRRSNEEINMKKEEIVAQNEFLHTNQLKIDEQAAVLERSNHELLNTKMELLKMIDRLLDAKSRLQQKEAEAKSILNALNEHYLVAHYDLRGQLISVNHKMVDLFGNVKLENVRGIRPMNGHHSKLDGKRFNNSYFRKVWEQIARGDSLAVEIEVPVGEKMKYFSTTLAPLFDSKDRPYAVMAIGQDITELMDKTDKIDRINEELKEKISETSQQNELLNFQQREIFLKNEKLSRQAEEIGAINESLEERVKERTYVLEKKNKQLAEYAFINSHVLRAPVSTMLGLVNLISYSSLSTEDRKVYEHLVATAKILDNIVYRINNAIDQGFHFDRNYLEPEREFQPMR
jgi:PAS domain-containing protein